MSECKDCTRNKLCRSCAIKYSNRRMQALGKGKHSAAQRSAWLRERTRNMNLDRAIKGAPADKVPIARVKWLEREDP